MASCELTGRFSVKVLARKTPKLLTEPIAVVGMMLVRCSATVCVLIVDMEILYSENELAQSE